MALIEKYRGNSISRAIDADSEVIVEGMLVAVTSAGVRRVESGDANKVYGIAADTSGGTASGMPGVTGVWQNKASEMFSETRASGMITVYNQGGEYQTDQFVDTDMDATKVGHYLIADETTGTLKYGGVDIHALLDSDTKPVAQLIEAAGTVPSGQPGIDVNGDQALAGANSNKYIGFKLLV